MKPETRLEIAQRLVAEAEGLVLRQQQLVAVLEKDSHRTNEAQQLLSQFEAAQASFRRTLALMQSLHF